MESVGEYEYNTKDLIGHGAFAVVFKGRHKKNHNMVVAIKSITKKNLSKSQNLLGKEIKILKELTELHHENVVALLDCKETPHHVYLVMEYCNGGDLADYLHAKGTLSEDTIRLFLRQLAGAMKALNAKGIVHRDLKPQNILLCYSANKPNPPPSETKLKIADFGFARFLQDGVMAATLCGSPMYMAPEVIMSLQYDAKADLWSIGTIVFQCLTGKAPFQAQTPQALKQLYEKNANLTPKIPSGTSSELTDLLSRLLKRNAKDRMEFDEFFIHPFHKKIVRPSSPVPVPTRQRSLSQGPSPSRTTGSPLIGNVPAVPAEEGLPNETPYQEMAIAASPPEATFPTVSKNQNSPLSLEEHEDFVVVPANLPVDNSGDIASGATMKRRSSDLCNFVPGVVGASPPRASIPGDGAHYPGNAKPPQSSSPLSTSPRPTYLPVMSPPGGRSPMPASEPIPVPSQKEAYQQIQQSLRESPGREPTAINTASIPKSPKVQMPKSQPINVTRTTTSEAAMKLGPDVSSLSPPSVQFTIGTPPLASRRRHSSSGGSIGTPPPPSMWSVAPSACSTCHTPTNSPIRRSVGFSPPIIANQNYILGAPFLPPILGSPTKPKGAECNSAHMEPNCNTNLTQPLMVPFGTRAQTLPDISGKDYLSNTVLRNQVEPTFEEFYHKSGNMGLLADPLGNFGLKAAFGTSLVNDCNTGNHNSTNTVMMPYGRSPPYLFNCDIPAYSASGAAFCHNTSPTGAAAALPFGTSPPNMEGPVMFIAPDLPEETLMEREHNDTLAKLNFVLALVDCILELARSRSSPISALTESALRRDNSEEQVAPASEAHRRAEQLVLYVRALQMLSSSLTLSREGLNSGRLQPSTSVKNVLSTMKERYRQCLNMCKLLNTQGLLNSVGIDPNVSNITADRLIYGHAIEMCQSAALDELFGNPQECFRRYQTAQILLHSLAQQVNSDDDRTLLNKYKEAVEKRLFVLQQQGYIFAYDTT